MFKAGIFGGVAFLIGEFCYRVLKVIITAVFGTLAVVFAIGIFFLLVKSGFLVL